MTPDLAIVIPLTKGKHATINKSDAKKVNKHKWVADQCGDRFYAAASINGKKIRLHNFLLGAKGIDHINGDGLDNRRENLRVCTQSQNNANMKKTKSLTHSKFKGVTLQKGRGIWLAQTKLNGKHLYLGSFKTEVEAAKCYNKFMFKTFGVFARLNEVDG